MYNSFPRYPRKTILREDISTTRDRLQKIPKGNIKASSFTTEFDRRETLKLPFFVKVHYTSIKIVLSEIEFICNKLKRLL